MTKQDQITNAMDRFYNSQKITIRTPRWVQGIPLGSRCWYHIIEDVVRYCCYRMELEELDIIVKLEENSNCCGESWQKSANKYGMRICTKQSLRDIIATICHEMVHVQQWVDDAWNGDGEREAEDRQYQLADDYWNWKGME
tara:strand:- start:41 stop:463 length:423 start_codon:yes stop_codon:yes gene_type:complete